MFIYAREYFPKCLQMNLSSATSPLGVSDLNERRRVEEQFLEPVSNLSPVGYAEQHEPRRDWNLTRAL